MPTISDQDLRDIERVNQSGRQPVLFIHGLWLLSESWAPWITLFENHGFAAFGPSWPDEPDTVVEANRSPKLMQGRTVGEVADHLAAIVGRLDRKPILIGHSFGGLLAQMLAGRGLSQATVAISPAAFRGVLPLPLSALRSAWPVLRNPGNRRRAVALNFDQFRYTFANAVDNAEAGRLYASHAVPASGTPIFQAAAANLNPWTEIRVDTDCANRGPMLIIAGEKDHTVPPVVARAAYRRQRRNGASTQWLIIPGRGHALTIDHGWRDVAKAALNFMTTDQALRRTAPATRGQIVSVE